MSQQTLKRLVIVESPTKARTIRRFLPGKNFQIEASMGHVRDLPASAAEIPDALKRQAWAKLGVNINDDFEPLYIVSPRKKKVVSKLKTALKQADELYIATDEDREGESIGWHLLELLKPKIPVRRMVFHEITQDAIETALTKTRDIDQNLVDAQETRRVLDRLVGYSISPLLWKKIAPKLSAGRVQSVAVRLMVLREKERIMFIPASYWDLKADLSKANNHFEAVMTHYKGIRLATGRDFDDNTGTLKEGLEEGKNIVLLSEAKAKDLSQSLPNSDWTVSKVEERLSNRSPAAPFTTSTLQQEASRKLGLSAKETMRIAQGLYENGYITYMRTDSTNLSQEAIAASRKAIVSRYGEDYLPAKVRQYSKKARNAQEAHEAIRPAGKAMKTKEEQGLAGVEGSLYDLIWKRTVASQMADARLRFVTALIEAGTEENVRFRASGRTTLFPGFFRAYVEGSDDPDEALDNQEQPLPDLKESDILSCHKLGALGHQTKAPARYTEASLVKLLEKEGIGRPSTYASIMDTVVNRGYARKHKKQLVPTFTAFAVNNLMESQFDQLVDTGFTAHMEQKLDDIATGQLKAIPYLKDFYFGSNGLNSKIKTGLEAIDARAVSSLNFPKWGDYIIRVGRFGPYAEGEIDDEKRTASIPNDMAPADIDEAYLEELITNGKAGDEDLGKFPETDQAMLLRRGPYGPYLQLGDDDAGKPKRVSLPKSMSPEDVTPEIAIKLLSLPRTLGEHPETGKAIVAHIGRFGPYVKHERTFASLPKDESVLDVALPRALELISQKAGKSKAIKSLGEHPESGEPIEVFEGRYGPYVKHKKTNASLKNGQTPETISLEEALILISEREASKGKKGKKKKAKPKKKVSKAKAKRPKASTADLEKHLDQLEEEAQKAVILLEGMKGNKAKSSSVVAKEMGIKEEDLTALHKRAMFKLRMAFGRARKEAGD